MRYVIKECEVYGIKHAFLFLIGWVEKQAVKLVIKDADEIFHEIDFSKTKSKIHSFSIRIPLSKTKIINTYQIVAIDNKNKSFILKEFKSTPLDRLKQKMQPDKYAKFTTKYLGEYKKMFDETYDLKNDKGYHNWIQKYEQFSPVEDYEYNPLISIIIPVYNVERKYLSECLDSILNQSYQNFEICLADDCSTLSETKATLNEYANKDSRIKVCFREKNGHISEASNSALSLATGEFIAMMDNDDVLMPQALNEIVRVLNENKSLDFIYTDEDKIDLKGNRSDPQFKPDLAIDKLYGGNYICHFNVIRKTIMEQVGGFRKGYEGAQDFDLFLRITEITDKFYHIPKILYHWRMIPGSTALDSGSKNYAGEAGKRALEDLFAKKNKEVQVDIVVNTHYSIEYINPDEPKVDIVIYIKEYDPTLLKRMEYMRNNLAYKNYSFVLIAEDENKVKEMMKENQVDILPFHNSLAATLNDYVNHTDSEYMLYLDESNYIDTFDAIDLMVGYCSQEHIGMVGAKIMNKHHIVVDSGYFLLKEKLLPVHYATYFNDYGYYGNLLVTNNYRIVEDSCCMVKVDKLRKIHSFDESVDEAIIFYDVCLRLFAKGLKNVVLPRVESISNKENNIYSNFKLPINKWKQITDVEKDLYYNVNLSTDVGYRLLK